MYIDFTEIRKQMFVEIGLSLLHLFPHRVDVSPLEKKKPMFLNALFFQRCLLSYCLIPLALSFCKLVCLEEGYTFQAAYEASFFFFSPLNCLH